MEQRSLMAGLTTGALLVSLFVSCGAPRKNAAPLTPITDNPARPNRRKPRAAVPNPVPQRTADPCEEILRQLEVARDAYRGHDATALRETVHSVSQSVEEARDVLREARAAARAANSASLDAQSVQRRLEELQAKQADEFRREILALASIGEAGGLEPGDDHYGKRWERFTVLESPTAYLYYEVDEEDPNSGERNRLAIQETMFTEFPKFWERTRSTRDEVEQANKALGEALHHKEAVDARVTVARADVARATDRLLAASAALGDANQTLSAVHGLERTYERCRGLDGMAHRIAKLGERQGEVEDRLEAALARIDEMRSTTFDVAPEGYRGGIVPHLQAATKAFGRANKMHESAIHAFEAAEHRMALSDRDGARDFLLNAEEEFDRVNAALGSIDAHLERALFSAREGQSLFFEDDDATRARLTFLAEIDRDHATLDALRKALRRKADFGFAKELWAKLPEWLAARTQLDRYGETDGNLTAMPEARAQEVASFVDALEEEFRPCSLHESNSPLLRRLRAVIGGASNDGQAFQVLSRACDLFERARRL